MRRIQLIWAAIFGLFFAAFAFTVAGLNSDVYSAHGFVRGYLDAIARHDTTAALDIPGVTTTTSDGVADDLLVPDTLGALTNIDFSSETVGSDGIHRVVFTWTADGEPGSSEYLVASTGHAFGLFNSWRFHSSPLETVGVLVKHARSFEANGVSATTDTPDSAAAYRVFTPARFVFTHESTYLTAEPQTILIPDATADSSVTVDVQASAAFESALTDEVATYLDECATQSVLMPTGCPFGFRVTDRITGPPVWSIADLPAVDIIPGDEVGSWQMRRARGFAHIVVNIESLFDGTVSTTDEDLPFFLGYSMTITPDGGLVANAEFE